MKKLFACALALLAVAVLPDCKRCCKKKCTESVVEEKRVSGPLADKEVNWDKEDFK